jgi:hypothetical protein
MARDMATLGNCVMLAWTRRHGCAATLIPSMEQLAPSQQHAPQQYGPFHGNNNARREE